MAAGLVLIGIGILIAVMPELLVAAISGFFMISGISVLMWRWRWRQMQRDAWNVKTVWW